MASSGATSNDCLARSTWASGPRRSSSARSSGWSSRSSRCRCRTTSTRRTSTSAAASSSPCCGGSSGSARVCAGTPRASHTSRNNARAPSTQRTSRPLSEDEPVGAHWENWAGNQQAHPRSVEHPADVEEVGLLVKRARADGARVKAIGSGHSFTAAGVTDGALLHLDRLSGVLSADRASGLVTVQGVIPLPRLNAILHDLDLAMTNLGDIDRQTIAGATSTGTHGTGQALGGLATQIRGLEIVIGDGSVVTCSATERPELFQSARVGLGALGVVTAVT